MQLRIKRFTCWTVRSIALWLAIASTTSAQVELDPQPFGPENPRLDSDATGRWWEPSKIEQGPNRGQEQPPRLMVARDEVIAFALYTHSNQVLKLTAQLYPLLPEESRELTLEIESSEGWKEVARTTVISPGWSAHFRVEPWDATQSVNYRVRLADQAAYVGTIRSDPIDKETIVVASLSCNSSRTPGPRETIIANLLKQDPDLLFFAGDQSYHHTQHTFGWIEWGVQFREVTRDRPTITIPDDHDVGHPNLWGENGKRAMKAAGPDGGYFFPVEYVKMVERCQTWHLPDPFDATPVERGISVYYTNLKWGEIDFAILEDRKFKTGPEGRIPQLGPRPDHIVDPSYDRASIDLPELELLGDRQLKFLEEWSRDWQGAQLKCVLSQTAFCGAVHLHGTEDNRLLADLDCNGWPQSGRNAALRAIRRVGAVHLCGDQHLAVVVKHGIDAFGDASYAFTSPAIVNTIYGRWWHPLDELPGPNPMANSPLPWTGDFLDGLGNRISLMAYANPGDTRDEQQRADGYGLVRFNKAARTVTFECWPRFADVAQGDQAQFPGWPITVSIDDNDGREVLGYLPEIRFPNHASAVIEVIDLESNETLYVTRVTGSSFRPRLFKPEAQRYEVRVGTDRPDAVIMQSLTLDPKQEDHVEIDW